MLGAGTQTDPYLIQTESDLRELSSNTSYWDGYVELANDIEMSSTPFPPISQASPYFTGVFNGNGYKVINLHIDGTGLSRSGLFALTGIDSTVRNVGIENPNIINAPSQSGALLGRSNSFISNCYVLGGSITSSNGAYIGGLVGYNANNSIENCYSTALVQSDGLYVGGLTGIESATTTSSYWDTETSGQTTSGSGAGLTTAEMKTQSSYVGWDFTTVWGMNGDYPYLQAFGVPTVPSKQESREVSSYANPIQSNVNIEIQLPPQTLTIEVNSHVKPIHSHTERHIASFRSVEGYSSRIVSSVSTSVISPNNNMIEVTSHINPIISNVSVTVYRQPLEVIRNVFSHIRSIQAHTDTITHLDTLPMVAYITIVENPSNSYTSTNPSNSTHVENPSYVEVIE
ncbi:GLUG motif-containing protein [Oceanobacillus massiliensis]|uniref:GLUG motif-containing protein n=1 Tax=Oceanobacillus massiliensis TaxID=1465765 RepID=UPI000287C9BD|nr:GLUG motif-containing protein [Oceanobacillus massiliensis]